MPISTRQGKSFPGDTFTDENRRFKSTDLVHPNHSKAFDHAVRMISLKRGMVDAIIFEKQSNGKSQFLVYLARRKKDDRTISAEDAAKIEYEISDWDRKVHIASMYDAGQQGFRDMSKFSRRFIRLPLATPLSAADISPDHDILGFDHPRKDIIVGKTASGKVIRTGGDTFSERSILSNAAMVVLDRNFTRDEVRKMNLYFEGSDTGLRGTMAGTCSTHRGIGKPVSTVSVRDDQVHESTITHEIVHALRAVDGRGKGADMDSEEIETEYETTLRTQKPRRMGLGYYQYLPDLTGELYDVTRMRDAALADRIMATGATDTPLKGRRLTHDIVPNTIMNSRIATAQPALRKHQAAKRAGVYGMIAEDVDTYFQIKLPDKSTVEYHIRFDAARPPLKEIKKHLKAKFGKNIDAWEWEDGKRVRLISRPKKTTRSRKQTTTKRTPVKKRTPAKRKTPTRKPVAVKRFGLDAILGVPEGFL